MRSRRKGPWSSGYDGSLTQSRSPVRIRLGPPHVLARHLFSDFNSNSFCTDSWLAFEDAIVCIIDTSEGEISPCAAIVPLRRQCRCMPHAQRYLLYGDPGIQCQLPSGGAEILPFEGYARFRHQPPLYSPEGLLGIASSPLRGDCGN